MLMSEAKPDAMSIGAPILDGLSMRSTGSPDGHTEEALIDIGVWKHLVTTAYDPGHWSQLAGDDNHRRIVERIGRPLRVKLLYDSYLWKWLLAGGGVAMAHRVVELLPGWSHTIAVALESLDFKGTLAQVDLKRPESSRTPFPFLRVWCRQDLLSIQCGFDDASLILGNHIADDLLICLALTTEARRQEYYSSPVYSRATWQALAIDPRLDDFIEQTVSVFESISRGLRHGQVMVLREYPSTTATQQGDAVRWALERRVQEAVFRRLGEVEDLFMQVPNLSGAPVPPGSRFPGSFALVGRATNT